MQKPSLSSEKGVEDGTAPPVHRAGAMLSVRHGGHTIVSSEAQVVGKSGECTGEGGMHGKVRWPRNRGQVRGRCQGAEPGLQPGSSHPGGSKPPGSLPQFTPVPAHEQHTSQLHPKPEDSLAKNLRPKLKDKKLHLAAKWLISMP